MSEASSPRAGTDDAHDADDVDDVDDVDTVTIRGATPDDLDWLIHHDHGIRPDECAHLVARGRVLLAVDAATARRVGWVRWGLFWDEHPFLTMLVVDEAVRGRGIGSRLVAHWEDACRRDGYPWVMTSTLSNERAQHLYRRLGYVDCGALLLPGEALEILLRKEL